MQKQSNEFSQKISASPNQDNDAQIIRNLHLEIEQLKVTIRELRSQLDEKELKEIISKIISETGASSAADMGKVMGAANKQLSGKADGKTISGIVKELLSGKAEN